MSEPTIGPFILFFVAAVIIGTMLQGSLQIGNGFAYDYDDMPQGIHEP